MEQQFEFKVGDVVSHMGVIGKVIHSDYRVDYPILVSLESDFKGEAINQDFTAEGLLKKWHKEPSLKFISREQKIEVTKSDLARVWDKIANDSFVQNSNESPYFKSFCKQLGFED